MTGRRNRSDAAAVGAIRRRIEATHQTTALSSWWHWRHGNGFAKEVLLMWALGLITAGTAAGDWLDRTLSHYDTHLEVEPEHCAEARSGGVSEARTA